MPINGGTRMLRARRKDINIKPNRRLDRKSSRGMLFENEELRMRTITINAEVEQGQHALKKLRRENEQLRREMWSLRDEYDKMEKLLRKKEEEDEDSDQENSYSDDNYSHTDESDNEDDDKIIIEEQEEEQKEENPDLENEENLQKSSKFGNLTNARTFDGLSVIDEQTEETTTQTTESAVGYGTISRGNSANRTVNQSNASNRMYDEACGLSEFQQYNYEDPSQDGYSKALHRKKGVCLYENGGGFVPYSNEWNLAPQCDNYNLRPASPYPYSESVQPSYQKRLQVLQNLPVLPGSEINENGWIFPTHPDYNMYVQQQPNDYTENGYLADKSVTSPISIEIPVTPGLDYNVIRDRAGPDIFIYPQPGYQDIRDNRNLESGGQGISESVISNVGEEIDKIEISQKTEKEPKNEKMSILTRSGVSHCGGEGGDEDDGEEEQETEEGKLSMAATFDKNDKETSKHVEDSVSCQNPNHKDVREINNPGNDIFPDVSSKISLFEDMPRLEKPNSSKFQSRLIVTLKNPNQSQSQVKAQPKKIPVPVQRVYQQQQQQQSQQPQQQQLPQQPLRYGIKPEYSINNRFQTFPNPNVRVPVPNGVTRYHNGQNYPVNNGYSATLPRTSNGTPKMAENVMLDTSDIPVAEEIRNELEVLPGVETVPVLVGQSAGKPVKIPPAPPPRSSSCPTTIPTPPVGVTALHHRTFRRAKSPSLPNQSDANEPERQNSHQPSPAPVQPLDPTGQNPLMLNEPMATSSPTVKHKATQGSSQSLDTQTGPPRLRKQSSNNTNEESSTEDISSRKSRPSRGSLKQIETPKLNKSVSSPSFGNFRMLRRKQSEISVSSVENVPILTQPPGMAPLVERKTSRTNSNQNNVSISSSSGLDSPTKSDRRKRRVSIKFNKKPSLEEERRMEEDRKSKESFDSRRESVVAPGILTVKNSVKHRTKSRNEETDATTSERERTNSVSSRTSSIAAGSGRRKFSVSSNRTYFNDEKIPWCGCWGNGCV